MRKVCALLLAATLLLSLCACGEQTENPTAATTTVVTDEANVTTEVENGEADATQAEDAATTESQDAGTTVIQEGATTVTATNGVVITTAAGKGTVAQTTVATKTPATEKTNNKKTTEKTTEKTTAAPTEAPQLTGKSGDFSYTVYGGKAVIDGYDGNAKTVTVPAKVDGYAVSEIDNRAFQNHNEITTLTLENGIEVVGISAFNGCTGIKTVTIPQSVVKIANKAFQGCSNITTVNAANVGAWANIEFGSDANPLLSGATLYIGGATVSGAVTLPAGTKRIGAGAFYHCTGLESIVIPSSVTEIGSDAFVGCTSLANVTFGNGITAIGNRAFQECGKITSLKLPTSLVTIGTRAFEKCKTLATVDFPASVETVEGGAFQDCPQLKTVNITDFAAWCRTDFKITSLKTANPLFLNKTKLYLNGTMVEGKVVFPKEAVHIGEGVMYGYPYITEAVFEEGIESIGGYVFPSCSALESVTIPNTVKTLGSCLFYDCDALTSISLPNSVTELGWGVFQLCGGLEEITLGTGLKVIGGNAFEKCNALKTVHYRGSEAQRQKIKIGQENTCLTGAKWNYNAK